MTEVGRPGDAGGRDRDVDVVVVGVGAAGCAAAITAHDAGANVLVLEKMPAGREGGNTRVSGGIWFHNLDARRSADYLRALCGRFELPEPVIEVWAEETFRNTEWVAGLGAEVALHSQPSAEYPELDGSDCYGGYMAVDGQLGDGRLFDVLIGAVRERGIEVLLDAPAERLTRDPDSGVVTGVAASHRSQPLRCRARGGVVLATGGFENNPGLVGDHLGLEPPAVWGSPAATGDGLRMAQQVGAGLWHMGNMKSHYGIKVDGWESGFDIPFHPGFVYVGPSGDRFADEAVRMGHGHAYRHGTYELFPRAPMWTVFDEATRSSGPLGPNRGRMPVGWNLLVEGYEWSADNQAEIDKGWIARGATLAELAGELGLPAAGLEAAVARYNASCRDGRDERFGRDPATLVPIEQPPFYGFRWGPVIGWTNGGPRRDERARVLDAFGGVVEGLYAAGNVSSTYSWCKDGGFHIADCLAFGRVAGRDAAARADGGAGWRSRSTSPTRTSS